MSNHSPAPWILDEYWGGYYIDDASGHTIIHDLGGGDYVAANAALIAAAPEMFEVLKELKAWRDKNDPVHTSHFYLEKIMTKVDSVIAKAEAK